MQFLIDTMLDKAEDMRYRIKSAEVIIGAATPKNPATIAAMLGDGGTTHLTIEFVNASKPLIVEHEPVTNGHEREAYVPSAPVTNGHNADSIDIVFVKLEEC